MDSLPSLDFLPLPLAASPAGPEHPILSAPAPRSPYAPDVPSAAEAEELDPEWMAEPPVEYLPNGARLVLTCSRKILFLTEFPHMAILPKTHLEAGFLLFLAGNPRTVWNAPVRDQEHGLLAPLHARADAFKDFVDGWIDRTFRGVHPDTILAQAQRLWLGQHANQVVIPATAASALKKKQTGTAGTSASIPSAGSATSSPRAIRSATNTSSTSVRSGRGISSSSAASGKKGSSASPRTPTIKPSRRQTKG